MSCVFMAVFRSCICDCGCCEFGVGLDCGGAGFRGRNFSIDFCLEWGKGGGRVIHMKRW